MFYLIELRRFLRLKLLGFKILALNMRVEILQMVKTKYKENEEDIMLLECSDFYLLNDDYV